ncbi:unnamed protein product [Rotaria socialis]|uniref:Envelope protein n=1 Tax=Rotaria socialis TaxID=392032 RepID=A0A818MSG0_9BILA|nr:unnamed protein product [Rotaria socialis]CAF3735804.1 unnamed protein product [Rotaria socialis]
MFFSRFSNSIVILLLFYEWIFCSVTTTIETDYFSRRLWLTGGTISHKQQAEFQNIARQHGNLTKHLTWLHNEISSLNRQLKLVKAQIKTINYSREHTVTIGQQEPTNKIQNILLMNVNNTQKTILNQQNVYIIKSLDAESLFDGYRDNLLDIYGLTLKITIECIAVFIEEHSIEKHLFIKLSNGSIAKYQMNKTQPLQATYEKFNRSMSEWIGDKKQIEYYQRFIHDTKTSDAMKNNQLMKIKNRPKSNDAQMFTTIRPVLQIKYNIDPLSISCLLEDFFGKIHTCDGRLIYPNELKILFNDKHHVVFYAIVLNATKETQIHPIAASHHARPHEQLFLIFNNDPELHSRRSCPDCIHFEQTFVLNNDLKIIEEKTIHVIHEPRQVVKPEKKTSSMNSQNYFVYIIVASISIYVLCNIYLVRRQVPMARLGTRHSMSSRRGR